MLLEGVCCLDGGLVLGLRDVEKGRHFHIILEDLMCCFVMIKYVVVSIVIFDFLINYVCPYFFVVVEVTGAWILIVKVFKSWNDSLDGRLCYHLLHRRSNYL